MAAEASKALKKMGFPAQEAQTTPAASMPKVQGCLTRRAVVMNDCCGLVQQLMKGKTAGGTAALEKILRKQGVYSGCSISAKHSCVCS